MMRTQRRGGFTLIELMITVGILGLLMTLAIPVLFQLQLRAKAAEVKGNLAAIRVGEEAYFGEYGAYVSALPAVPAAVGTTKSLWTLLPTDAHGFNLLGFRPEGASYFQYAVASNGSTAYSSAGRSDIDGDGVFRTWGYVHTQGQPTGVAGPFGTCPAAGVLDPATGAPNQIGLLGPCDPSSGSGAY